MSILVKDLWYSYNVGTPAARQALRGVTCTVVRGAWLAIVGHTGSGKSTLAQHLNLLHLPQRGSLSIDGETADAQGKNLRAMRRKVGLVFQYPEQQFFAETVREEIAFAPANWGVAGDDLRLAVETASQAVGLDASLLDANPFALSGGQQRRVALASVLSMRPDYLVLDEPTAGLDAAGIRELAALLSRLRGEGMGVVQVTHDLQSALEHSDGVLVLENGASVVEGEPERVAAYLAAHPVRGLIVPPLVRFAAGLRDRGLGVPLTAGYEEILRALEEGKPCVS